MNSDEIRAPERRDAVLHDPYFMDPYWRDQRTAKKEVLSEGPGETAPIRSGDKRRAY